MLPDKYVKNGIKTVVLQIIFMNTSAPKAIFFEVKNAQDKLKRIFQTAEAHFEKSEPLLLLVSDSAAALFIDEWLWKLEETSFLPHLVSDLPSSEIILISTKQEPHDRNFLFNLSADLPPNTDKGKIFYEFDDSSSPLKKELSKKKFEFYRERGFLIESR
jgi:DNA polymerase-3 subunit chi